MGEARDLATPQLKDSLLCVDNLVKHSLLPQPQQLEAPHASSLLPLSLGRCVVVLEGLCSTEECICIADNVEKLSFQSLTGMYPPQIRQGDRLLVSDPDLAATLFGRLQLAMAASPELQEVLLAATPFGFGLGPYSSWRPVDVNDGMRICRYSTATGDGFTHHYDSQYCPSQLQRSVFSILIYLTDESTGGDTVFYHHSGECPGDPEPSSLEGYTEERVSPKMGRAVLFPHDTLHAGLQPKAGQKVLIRTDLIYTPVVESPYPMREWPVREQDAFLQALSRFREAQNLEIDSTDTHSLERACALYAESLRIRRGFGPGGGNAHASRYRSVQKTDTGGIVQHAHGSLLSCPGQSRHRRAIKEIMRRLSPIDQDKLAQTCKGHRGLIGEVYPHLHAPWLPQLLHRQGLKCIVSFDHSAYEEAKEACLRVAAMEAIAQFGHRRGSAWFISEWDPVQKRALAVPKSALLGTAYHELPCEGVFLHLERNARIDRVVNDRESDDEEVTSLASEDDGWGDYLTSDPIRTQELSSDTMFKQVDQQIVQSWFDTEGGVDIAAKCFATHDQRDCEELPCDELAKETARGLPILQDWVNDGGNFEDEAERERGRGGYFEEGVKHLKEGFPSHTILQTASAIVNFGPNCQHHGRRLPPRWEKRPVGKSLLLNNLIFDFRSKQLKVRPLQDVEDMLGDSEKQLISNEGPCAAAYFVEIERKGFNHAACGCGDYDEAPTEEFRRLHMGPSFLLRHVVLLVSCEEESWRCGDDERVCITALYGGVVAL